jgi:hypothetical protein
MPDRPKTLSTGTVGRSAGQIPFILRPRDVGRHMLFQQHMVILGRACHSARTRVPRLLFAGIHLAPPIGISASIERVLHHVLQGHAVGPAPGQRALDRAFPEADPKLNIVLDEIA